MREIVGKKVEVDEERIRENIRRIGRKTGVEVWPVIKADAYGLGARRIAALVGDLAAGFCFFRLGEAIAADVWNLTGRPAITLGPPESDDPEVYLRHHIRPAVGSVEEARRLRRADPILSIDTGMQRFSCRPEMVAAAVEAGGCREAFTHAVRPDRVEELRRITQGLGLKLHATATALLDDPRASLDAVRPGLAMYEGALRVTTALYETRQSAGPVGYTGFITPRHGVIVVGYSNGLRRGRCLVNGQTRRIAEVGMQSAYVEVGPEDKAGDEVVLMGEGLGPR